MNPTLADKERPMLQSEDRPKLSLRLSAGLDVARAAAACYVVLHHVAKARGWSSGPGLALRFGQEAVLIFFLLSGFVIFSNERTRATRPSGYYLRRLRGILSVRFGEVSAMIPEGAGPRM
jgi:peptidoglycan/LPS O-acetylase OafA/YrhL